MKWKTCFGLLCGVSALLVAQAGFAQSSDFHAPAEVGYDGKVYKLASKQEKGPRGLYEYTTNDESINGWTSLFTINYMQGNPGTPMSWAKTLQATLNRESPKPDYDLSMQGGHGYAQIIYSPDAKNPDYEADVFESFHLPACGGLVVFQFAVKHPKETPPADADPKDFARQQLKKIALQTIDMQAALKASALTPTCGKAPDESPSAP